MAFDLTRDLVGAWSFDRHVRDHLAEKNWDLRGTATFSPQGPRLDYREEGTFCGAPGGDFYQTYQWWVTHGTNARICFDDGRPFVALSLQGGTAAVTHGCGADAYGGFFDFSSPTTFRQVWTIQGPRKDMVIETVYLKSY